MGIILANMFVGFIIYNIMVIVLSGMLYLVYHEIDGTTFKEAYLYSHLTFICLIIIVLIGWGLISLGKWIYVILLEVSI